MPYLEMQARDRDILLSAVGPSNEDGRQEEKEDAVVKKVGNMTWTKKLQVNSAAKAVLLSATSDGPSSGFVSFSARFTWVFTFGWVRWCPCSTSAVKLDEPQDWD
jgi:hypothetical protein